MILDSPCIPDLDGPVPWRGDDVLLVEVDDVHRRSVADENATQVDLGGRDLEKGNDMLSLGNCEIGEWRSKLKYNIKVHLSEWDCAGIEPLVRHIVGQLYAIVVNLLLFRSAEQKLRCFTGLGEFTNCQI